VNSAIRQIAGREWKSIVAERRYTWLIVTAATLFVLILGGIYLQKKLLRVPVLIVDQDHSRISRELTQAILANETFALGGYADSGDVFPAYVARDRAHICFVFPRGLEKDLLSGKPAKVEVLVDNSNYLAGKTELNSATTVLTTYSVGAEIHMAEAMYGVKQKSALPIAQPYEVGTRMGFNPPLNYNYLNFMVQGLVYIAIQLSALFLVIRSGAAEFAGHRGVELKRMTRSVWTLVAGKLLPYIAIAIPLAGFLLLIPHMLFGVPFRWASFSLWFVLVWYVLMLVTLGFGFSCQAKDPIWATELCASVTMPNFLLSGYTWPIMAMPKIVALFATLMPMGPAALMMRKISLIGGSLADCGVQIAVLMVWSLFALFLAWRGAKAILALEEGGPDAA
jgi:ABC-2 type transport system permease protein